MTRLRVGIAGAGVIAGVHVGAVRDHGGAEVVAVQHPDVQRARQAAAEWEVAGACSTIDDLLSDAHAVDAVIVATPPAAHADAALAALAAGKHVLCEKPLSRTFAEAQAIVDAAEGSPGVLACCSGRLRCTPAHREALRLIAAEELGDVYHVHYRLSMLRSRPGHHVLPHATWFLDRSSAGGGAMIDLGVYAVDAALSLLGDPKVTSVLAQTYAFDDSVPENVRRDVEDHALIMLQCDGGRSAVIEAAWLSNQVPAAGATVLGTKAGLRLDPLTKVSARRTASGSYEPVEEQLLSDPELGILGAPTISDITKHFLDALATATEPVTSARESLQVMRILDAAYRSAATGETTPVDALEPARGA